MQIKSLTLYNNSGQTRVLNFQLNAVNVITGASQTGKSSLIHIIDYCLGRSTFQVAQGVITDVVMWYGLLLQFEEFEVFIAKPKPEATQASQSAAYFQIAASIDIPNMSDLILNSNDDAINIELSQRIGINPNLNIPPEGQTRDALEATLSHAKLLLFQPQSVIANREVLFYRQSDPFMSQAIKDTLPYFLGIIQEDRLRLLKQLHEKRRQARSLKKELQEAESLIQQRIERGISLVLEAQQVGLLNNSVSVESKDAIYEALVPIRNWQPSLSLPSGNDKLFSEQTELDHLRREFQTQIDIVNSAKRHVKYASAYLGEAAEQTVRLETINLFEEESASGTCPLCGSAHEQNSVSIQSIENSLRNLQSDVSFVTRERPDIDSHITALEAQLETLRLQIQQKALNVQALLDEQDAAIHFRDNNARIARIVGRVSYFLDVTPITLDDETTELRLRLERVNSDITGLEAQLDQTNLEDRRASILNIIGADMTQMSTRLNLEHSGPYRLDLNRLTVIVDRPDRPIIMNQNMGSASNHLGCHLISLLALHRFFIQQRRPVPSFLVLDQPTQVYFPIDRYQLLEGEEGELSDEDRIAVRNMFNLLFDFSKETGLQIIVLEHASLDDEDFQNAIIDGVWRQGNALIPAEWINQKDENAEAN